MTSQIASQFELEKPQVKERNFKKVFIRFFSILTVVVMVFGFLKFGGLKYIEKIRKGIDTSTSSFTFKAKVVYLSGEGAWNMVDNRKIEIKENDLIEEGDLILTEENTRLVLVFDDSSILRIGPNSRIFMANLEPSEMVIKEEQGTLFARVNKDSDHKLSISAGKFLIESMGTAFSVEKKDGVKVNVFESKVNVKAENKDIEVKKDEQWEDVKDKVEKTDENETEKNEFLSWSLNEEKLKKMEEKTVELPLEEVKKPIPSGSIQLNGGKVENGISLEWKVSNLTSTYGFKLVRSLEENPVFPGDVYVYLDNPNIRNYVWQIKDAKKWRIRACQYLGNGECGVYSNEIIVEAPLTEIVSVKTDSGETKSISLKGEKINDNKVNLRWNIDGYSAKGFKICWSSNTGPTYPTREGDEFSYQSNPELRGYTVSGLETGRKYYFRVCEYLGGKCGVYSNEVSF